MNTLIIYTHPNHNSLSYAFLQKIIEGSKENPHVTDLKVIDLYEEKFSPQLIFNEDKLRRDMHTDADLEKYRKQILWADKIVFVYPIWWGRPPAMLLGFIDRVFASNFAYKNKGRLGMAEGLLKGKSVVCVSTMKGPTNYPLIFLNNVHKVLMKKAIMNFVGVKKVKFFEFGNMESQKGKQSQKLNKTYHYFQKVSN
ncbi:NAD(P)H-dependent oxidoreductase [Cytobacillus sp. IB215316]|uniref:NAD(P)H-dependent oxidoreductase n=1 Tax=Cytobacillus sp. IB215316 TaxID=3097354 RepID=UPI002A159062|nr:NAD(P)H-dependent oxidoreductase [Cytobacillus sp. IB215316]MDX8360527.1 NAD(P)H-dependent oxidoreductase [Cytobacillus sp. IB215316]